MIILRNKFFSDKEKGETKLKALDRIDIWCNKHLVKNKERKRKYLKGEANPFSTKNAALIGAGTGSVFALPLGETPISAALDKKYKKAAILSVGGAVIHPMINKATGSVVKSGLKKDPHINDKNLDRLDVAEGKMSKEEFARKWYKDESKKIKK